MSSLRQALYKFLQIYNQFFRRGLVIRAPWDECKRERVRIHEKENVERVSACDSPQGPRCQRILMRNSIEIISGFLSVKLQDVTGGEQTALRRMHTIEIADIASHRSQDRVVKVLLQCCRLRLQQP